MAGYSRPAVARIFGVPALGGLLFGWDIGATSYVLTQLQSAEYSGVSWHGAVAGSSLLQGLVTSGGVAGALIGAAIVFRIADAIGRRRELIIAACLYIAGAALEVASGSFGTSETSGLALLLLGRLVYGAACGFAMHGAPAYIAEMSPASIRGTLISLKEAAIVLGICAGYGFGYAYSEVPGGWRWAYGWTAPFSVLLFVGAKSLPPSARWLALRGKQSEAVASLAFVYPNDVDARDAAAQELAAASEARSDAPPPRLGDRRYRRALTAGLGVVLLQQFTGQPSVLYYAGSIFESAGVGAVASVAVGVFKLVATLGAVATVDKYGRRKLLFIGISLMVVALVGLAIAFQGFDGEGGGFTPRKVAIIGLIFLYIAAYQISFGPIAWLLISELFPLEVRGQAVALAVQANFGGNMLVALLFPVARDALRQLVGADWAMSCLFATFAVIAVYALEFVRARVPETKGLSLEEIERHFAAGDRRTGIESPLIAADGGELVV
jgi:sugar porter (SP) family MFS transporter